MGGIFAIISPKSALAMMACFCTSLLTCGTVFTMGVYYDDIKRDTGQSHFATSFVFSLTQATMQTSGLLTGILLKFASERTVVMLGGLMSTVGLFLAWTSTYYFELVIYVGVLTGVGQGLGFVTNYIVAGLVFDVKYHHIALSVSNTGGGLGMFLFPLIYELLIRLYSWRGALLIIGGVALHVCLFGALMNTEQMRRNKRVMRREAEDGEVKKRSILKAIWNSALWNQLPFYMLLFNTIVFCFGYSITFTYLYPHLIQQGVSKKGAALVFSAYGVGSLTGRILTTVFNNRRLLKRWVVFTIAHLTMSCGIFLLGILPKGSSVSLALPPVLLMGVSNGLQDTLLSCVCLDLLGPNRLTDAISLLVAGWGLGSLFGATVGGLIRDQFSTYAVPICLAAALNLTAGLVLLPLKWFNKYSDDETATIAMQSQPFDERKTASAPVYVPSGSILELGHQWSVSLRSLLK